MITHVIKDRVVDREDCIRMCTNKAADKSERKERREIKMAIWTRVE